MRYFFTPICRTLTLSLLALCASLFASTSQALQTSGDARAKSQPAKKITFAVIGDFGSGNSDEEQVSNLVKNWHPDFIITVGDNNYPSGEKSTIKNNIEKPYGAYIAKTIGENKFFPTLGNHDWNNAGGTNCHNESAAQPYLDFFTLPENGANERYYKFMQGSVEFFALDSDCNEPDGITDQSKQAKWLQTQLKDSKALFKIVYFHHAPFSSGEKHGSTKEMQWPFKDWGATAVISGHDHDYERLNVKALPYFVNGIGGGELREVCDQSAGKYLAPGGAKGRQCTPVCGSILTYNRSFGAMKVTADDAGMIFELFIVGKDKPIDACRIGSTHDATLPFC